MFGFLLTETLRFGDVSTYRIDEDISLHVLVVFTVIDSAFTFTSEIAVAVKVDAFSRIFVIRTPCCLDVLAALEVDAQTRMLSNHASCFSHDSAVLEVEALIRTYFRRGSYSFHVPAAS